MGQSTFFVLFFGADLGAEPAGLALRTRFVSLRPVRSFDPLFKACWRVVGIFKKGELRLKL